MLVEKRAPMIRMETDTQGISRGRRVPKWASDTRDYRRGSGRRRGFDHWFEDRNGLADPVGSLTLGIPRQIWRGKRLGPPPGFHHDLNSPTRYCRELGMLKISRIASDVDALWSRIPMGFVSPCLSPCRVTEGWCPLRSLENRRPHVRGVEHRERVRDPLSFRR